MPRKEQFIPITLILPAAIPAVCSAVPDSAPLETTSSVPDFNTPVLLLLTAIIVLLLGLWYRFRDMRRALISGKTALEKREQHIQSMGDNLPNVTIFQLACTPEGGFSFNYLSRGYERAFGFSCDEVLEDARHAFEHVYETDIPILRQAYDHARSTLSPADIELRVLDVSGKLKWLRISAVPRMEGKMLVWDGFMQDISVNKNIEDALLEENRNFQNLFATIDDFLLICDMNGRLLHSNPSVEQRMGYTHRELRSMNFKDLYAPKWQSEIARLMIAMQTEQTMSCGFPMQLKTGGTISVEMNLFQGSWKNKKAFFGVARDITRRQRTENALRESQQMLQLIMDTIPMSVFWKDKDSVYLGCNKTFIAECGLNAMDEVVGKTPYDLFDPAMASIIVERDNLVISNNQPTIGHLESHTRLDGSIGWREINKIPLRDEEERAVGVLGVWRDVTEQRRAEERLKRTLEDMERFNQLMRGRERRTLELKAEINHLLKELGQPRKYRTTTEDLS